MELYAHGYEINIPSLGRDDVCGYAAWADNLPLLKWFVSIGCAPCSATLGVPIVHSTSPAMLDYLVGLDVQLPENLNNCVRWSRCFKVWKRCADKAPRFDVLYLLYKSGERDDATCFRFAHRLSNRQLCAPSIMYLCSNLSTCCLMYALPTIERSDLAWCAAEFKAMGTCKSPPGESCGCRSYLIKRMMKQILEEFDVE